ncbi:helix-turn-helix domain-containing protein [Gemmobacter caeruleus]|uniref:helix-turn-helix domain-containing protein n=1 Tax=Gemmobacter caeruleus TaxID=2595004 RepID=UPI0011EFBD57|nr:helix-turn-helix transcriptional regulator [Gemmobacter caeruleus]
MTETMTEGWFSAATATFGDRLAGAREAADWSQEALARRLGVRLSTLQAWENDSAEPRANRLQMLAGMLNVSLVWLLTGEGEGPEGPPPEDGRAAESRRLGAGMARLRQQALAMSRELGQMEQRMAALAREGTA